MKSSWFSLFKRKDRHRGTVVARKGDKTGCIQICPVCECPILAFEMEYPNWPFYINNACVKSIPNSNDRIYIFGEMKFSLSGCWNGSQDLSRLVVCELCYLKAVEDSVKEARSRAIRNRAIDAYDSELDCEIKTDAWGVTREQFESIAKSRGDL